MKFLSVSQAFLALEGESSRTAMTELLAALFKVATPHEAQLISYLTLGTLRAPYEGYQFNLAEKSMIKVIAQIKGVELADFTKLVKVHGDIGKALIESTWNYGDQGLSLEDVYTQLESIRALSGTGSHEEKAAALTRLITQMDAVSASFITRIVIGTMRLGLSDMTLLDGLSWMVTGDKSLKKILEQAYNMCADIGLIAYTLKKDGVDAVAALKPTLGIPIRLAAAERAESPRAIIERLGTCVAQPKLDGFRLQIHIKKTGSSVQMWFFSRNLLDMSPMFPDLTKALESIQATTLIVEGEAIVYDEETERFLPFQETVKRKRKHGIEEIAESLPLRLYLFDILYLNGQPLIELGHDQRRVLLINLFGNYPYETVQVIQEKLCHTVQELSNYFNEQITQGLEGLVVKRPDAAYQAGKRNFNWIKLKRHHEGELRDTLDAVILGYYSGRGKRGSFGIGAFLVGVYNDDKECYETIAKVGTGLTDLEWLDLKHRCDSYRVHEKPIYVNCAPELTPDVWVAPNLVAVILADEITQSPLHTTGSTETTLGLALRFPRFMGFALDKKAEQATTVKECRRLFELQFKG
jgi:DNA ligase-1